MKDNKKYNLKVRFYGKDKTVITVFNIFGVFVDELSIFNDPKVFYPMDAKQKGLIIRDLREKFPLAAGFGIIKKSPLDFDGKFESWEYKVFAEYP